MKTVIIINAVSFEAVSGKYWAHHNKGRFTLTEVEYNEMKTEISKSGEFKIMKIIPDNLSLSEMLATAI